MVYMHNSKLLFMISPFEAGINISVDEPSENGFHTVRDAAPADKVEQPSPSAAQPKNMAAVPFADDSSHI